MNNEFKVIHVITTIERGGAENQLLTLVRQQVSRGYKVSVYFLKGENQLQLSLEEMGVEVKSLKGPFAIQYLEFRIRIHSKSKAIIHGHLPRAEMLIYGISNRVISRHNTEPFFSGDYPLISAILARLSSRGAHMIYISNAVMTYMHEHRCIGFIASERVIYYGLEHQTPSYDDNRRKAWRQEYLSVGNDVKMIGTIARLVPQKDIETLLRAFAKICENRTDVYFAIVGEGYLRKELENLAITLQICNQVKFLGRRNDIDDFLLSIDLFVLSSKYEGLGLVLLECLRCLTPIIAAHNSAIIEVVTPQTGLLFETGNISDLTEKMEQALDNRIQMKDLAAAGNLRLQNKFSPLKMCQAIEDVYSLGTHKFP